MKSSIQAALLSALVLPGLGHFYLKRYIRGALFVVVTTVALFAILNVAYGATIELMAKIQMGQAPLDLSSLTLLVMDKLKENEQLMKTAGITLLAVWVFSTLDAYRIGRLAERPQAQ